MTSKCLSERKNCMSLLYNQKVEMIKPSEEGMLEARVGLNLGLFYPVAM